MTTDEIADFCHREFAIVVSTQVTQEEQSLRCYLRDGSYPDIFVGKTGLYSYHWQRATSILRFNNAPHFDSVESAPHHLHSLDGSVKASPVTGVSEEDVRLVFRFIYDHVT